MSDKQKIDQVLERVEPGRRAAVRKILTLIYAGPVVAALPMDSLASVANTTKLYAVLDIGTVGSITHQVVSIDISDPTNIRYVAFGTISRFADKYFVSATLDPILSKIFFAFSLNRLLRIRTSLANPARKFSYPPVSI